MAIDPRNEAYEILQAVNEARERFGKPMCKKYTGAATAEILREHLWRHGLATSPRDVFVRGAPTEIDLLLPRPDAKPWRGVLYEPEDVLFVFEVKACGTFGELSRRAVERTFQRIGQAGPMRCAYVTIWERAGFRWAVKEEALPGHKAYTLFRHRGKPEDLSPEDATGDWARRLSDLTAAVRASSA